jgi:hypothetical protein
MNDRMAWRERERGLLRLVVKTLKRDLCFVIVGGGGVESLDNMLLL